MPLPTTKSEKETNHLGKKYLFYGEPKIGKTTYSSEFGDDNNKAIFFCAEPGHSEVEIYKWSRSDGHQPQTWDDFKECCRELYATDKHDFRLLVIDTVDILWKWCTDYICKINGISHPSEMGFGKAYQAIGGEFSNVCNRLGQRGIGFIFISHMKEYEIQVGPRKENCIDTTLPSGAQKFIHGFVDYIWFFGITQEGERFILTERSDNIRAGSRGDIKLEPLPIKMPMNPKKVIHLMNNRKPLVDPIYDTFDENEEISI